VKLLFRLFVLAVTSFYTTASWAEGGCPEGQRPAGTMQNWGCMPIPRYYDNTPAAPPPKWADRWGAIVTDPVTGGIGMVAGRASESEAINAAMNDCAASNGKHCILQTTYHNQCAAVAWGSGAGGYLSTYRHPSKSEAEKNVVNNCMEKSGSSCKVIWSDCSLPVRVQ
jgi:hypothetical protein